MARACALGIQDAVYEMLMMWLNKMGQGASVNIPLGCLGNAREKICEGENSGAPGGLWEGHL